MQLFSDFNLGIFILGLCIISGIIFFLSPGSVRIQKPQGGFASWAYNIIHFGYELLLIPLAGIDLLSNDLSFYEMTQFSVNENCLIALRVIGVILIITGTSIFGWSRIILRKSFRIASIAPDKEDVLYINGPYRLMRNPMYTSVLCNCLGFVMILQSYLFLALFFIFLLLQVAVIIPQEEKQLENHYGEIYFNYKRKVKRFIPFVY